MEIKTVHPGATFPPGVRSFLKENGIDIVTATYISKDGDPKDPENYPRLGHFAIFNTYDAVKKHMSSINQKDPVATYVDTKVLHSIFKFTGDTLADLTTLEHNRSDYLIIDLTLGMDL